MAEPSIVPHIFCLISVWLNLSMKRFLSCVPQSLGTLVHKSQHVENNYFVLVTPHKISVLESCATFSSSHLAFLPVWNLKMPVCM